MLYLCMHTLEEGKHTHTHTQAEKEPRNGVVCYKVAPALPAVVGSSMFVCLFDFLLDGKRKASE